MSTQLEHDLHQILSEGLKHDAWRPNQHEAVKEFIAGNDVFVISPTGSGKSAIYQVPGLYLNGLTHGVTVVFTPLISLMKEQMAKLYLCGFSCVGFWHNQDSEQRRGCLKDLRAPDRTPAFAFLTPEMYYQSGCIIDIMKNLRKRGKLSRLVIDESQCLLSWGETFRPAYLSLCELRRDFPDIPILALSASIRDYEVKKTINHLKMQNCKIFTDNPDRKNLYYSIKTISEVSNFKQDIIDFISGKPDKTSGIIYCPTKKSCDGLVEILADAGIHAMSYYSDVSDKKKDEAYHKWIRNECPIIVATTAFGMGIDKPDVRFVIHFGMPWDLGSFYQQSGRAGRDGKLAHSVIYYKYTDLHRLKKIDLLSKDQSRENLALELTEMLMACINRTLCRRYFILGYIDQEMRKNKKLRCEACDICLSSITWKIMNAQDWASALIKLFKEIKSSEAQHKVVHISLGDLVNIFCGSSQSKKSVKLDKCARVKPVCKLAGIGKTELRILPNGSKLTRNEATRIAETLIVEHAFIEYCGTWQHNGNDHLGWYLKIEQNAQAILKGNYFPCAFRVKKTR